MGDGAISGAGRRGASRAAGGSRLLPDPMSVAEANRLLSKTKLTAGEKDALTAYQRGSDQAINTALRGTGEKTAAVKANIRKLDSAIEKSPGLARNTVLYRGINKDGIKEIWNGYRFTDGNPIGKVINDKAFVSTAFQKKAFDLRYNKSDVVLRIVAPKGTKGIPMHRGHTKQTGMEFEKEFLLGRGQQMRVTGFRRLSSGRLQLDVTLESPKK